MSLTSTYYLIDRYEVRLKSAQAARDWDEANAIFNELKKLYAIQNDLLSAS